MSVSLLTCAGGCDPAPPTEIRVLSIRSPKSGRILFEGVKRRIDPRQTLEIEVSEDPPYVMTFIDDVTYTTLAGIRDEDIDLSGLFGEVVGVPAGRSEINIRPTGATPSEMVIIVDGQVYRAEQQSELWTFQIPQDIPGSLIAYWPVYNGGPHLGLKALPAAGEVEGRAISVGPNLALDREVPLLVDRSPNGWMKAELVFDGIRTGIDVVEGLVGPSKARAIPAHPTGEDFGLSWWITLHARENLPSPSVLATELEIPFFRSPVALRWAERADVDPPLRSFEEAVHHDINEQKLVWSEAATTASWLRLGFEALGTCQETNVQLLGPTGDLAHIPSATIDRLRDAPWVRVSVDAVHRLPWDWSRFLGWGSLGLDIPRYLSVDEHHRLEGFWQLKESCSEGHPLEGLYSGFEMGDCRRLAPKARYLIDGCGHLINLTPMIGRDGFCGRFDGSSFRQRSGGQVSFRTDESGLIHLGDEEAGLILRMAPKSDTAIPRFVLGAWSRYEGTEQEAKVENGRILGGINQPVRIAYGHAEPEAWLEANADGRIHVRAKFIDAPGVIVRRGEGFGVSLYGTGCADTPRILDVDQNEQGLLLTEEVPTEDPTVIRIRRFQFRR
ncbi:MAG: hypothetical protein VX589_00375 [Myxococcota bacterium]|nr:hypothetical protein [Myxococcota bacterium]